MQSYAAYDEAGLRLTTKEVKWSRNDGQKKDVDFFCYGN